MLKKVIIRDKEIPVPVPVLTLADALKWAESTFVRKDSVITSILLNKKEVLGDSFELRKNVPLDEDSLLEFKIDSPKDLSIQTLDAVRELSHAMFRRIKSIAVKCWSIETDTHLTELAEMLEDIRLTIDLINHVNGMTDYSHENLAPINGLAKLIIRTCDEFNKARKACDWRKVSVILVNRLEPLLRDLVNECDALQINILAIGITDDPVSGTVSL